MNSILKKGYVFVAAAVLVVSVYFIAGILVSVNRQYNAVNIKNMEEAVSIIGRFTPSDVFTDKDAASQWISRLDNSSLYRVTLISRNGQVIFDTDADSTVMDNHLDRPEFQTAIKEGTGSASRLSATMGQYYLYAAAAIHNPQGVFSGVLRISRLLPGFYTRLLDITLPFIILGFILILGSCAGLYYFSRRQSFLIEAKLNKELEKKTNELNIKAREAEAESRYREVILNSVFDGLITLDSDLNIIFVNQRFCSMLGVEKEEKGVSLLEFSSSAELEEAARVVLSTGRTHEFTFNRYTSGRQQCFQGFAAPLDQGLFKTPPELVIVLGDISRLVKLENVRRDFAANVSHELRTPIQVIQGFAENILNAPSGDKKQIRCFAEIIRKNAMSMDNLTNDLLTLVSLENVDRSRFPLEEAALDLIINEAVEIVDIAAKEKKIIITVSCPCDLKVKVYSSLFIQALFNLLDNSIKYSEEGSQVNIRVYRESAYLIIEVKDNGIGIPAEHMDRIFERFYRIDRSRSREAGGTGLGLSIVRHIAMLHKGSIEAESHAGEGSIFRLKLPC